VHLAGVGVAEAAGLEIDDDQAFQPAVEEQQIDPEPGVVQPQAALAADEGEIVAQLEQEIRQMLDQCALHPGFGVAVVKVQELQDEGVLDGLLRGHPVARHGQRSLFQQSGLVPGEGGAFVELAVDLPVELAHGPTPAKGLRFVEGAAIGARYGEQADIG